MVTQRHDPLTSLNLMVELPSVAQCSSIQLQSVRFLADELHRVNDVCCLLRFIGHKRCSMVSGKHQVPLPELATTSRKTGYKYWIMLDQRKHCFPVFCRATANALQQPSSCGRCCAQSLSEAWSGAVPTLLTRKSSIMS